MPKLKDDRTADGKLNYANFLIERCEQDLGRTLPNSERRDLLKDNTDWDTAFINRCVEWLAGKTTPAN